MLKKYLTDVLKKATNNWLYFFIGLAFFDLMKEKVEKYSKYKSLNK